jgi:deazaflavin-dependent oxidoreductase (nitroreductase family)
VLQHLVAGAGRQVRGRRRETPVTYFTDGDDVILIASDYGGARHPDWCYNLLAHPGCELHIGPRGGRFVARETQGAERDRLFTRGLRGQGPAKAGLSQAQWRVDM